VALMGMAAALDAPLAATAGAVVSGAYFGDKMSPLSDTTNITAIAAGVPLFTHIRHMLFTAVPSFGAALLVYALAGGAAAGAEGGLPASAVALLGDIERVYWIHWIVLLPAVVVVWGIARRLPAALALVLSSLVAAVLAAVVQPFGLQEALVAAVAGFEGEMLLAAGVAPAEVSETFLTLVQRGGLYSMATALVVVLAAFLLAAAMDVSGSIALLVGRLLGAVRSVFGLVAATMTAGAATIALTSHAGVTVLVIGGVFRPAYDERELAPENLSRSLEDSVTITEPLMPWTVSAVFMATTLGVATLHYAPWAVFCYGGSVFSLLIAGFWRRTGFGIRRRPPAAATPSA
jgi:Na+:H+ antiporter, NhaC family